MWPWGHAAVGYYCWSLVVRTLWDRPPTTAEVWVLLLATQVPDLVDKTLSWWWQLLPSGRSLAHSLFTTVLVVVIVVYLGRRFDTTCLSLAFALGYGSHIVSDAVLPLVRGETEYLVFLLWPLLPTPYDDTGKTFLGELRRLEYADIYSPYTILAGLIVLLWIYDDFPGIGVPDLSAE